MHVPVTWDSWLAPRSRTLTAQNSYLCFCASPSERRRAGPPLLSESLPQISQMETDFVSYLPNCFTFHQFYSFHWSPSGSHSPWTTPTERPRPITALNCLNVQTPTAPCHRNESWRVTVYSLHLITYYFYNAKLTQIFLTFVIFFVVFSSWILTP